MANAIRKESILIMCSQSLQNAREAGRFAFSLRILQDYTLQTLCCEPHNVCNEEGEIHGMDPNRVINDNLYVGPAFIVRDGGDGNLYSLTDSQISMYLDTFQSQLLMDEEMDTGIQIQ